MILLDRVPTQEKQKMKLDTEAIGTDAIFRPYQAGIIDLIYGAEEPQKSLFFWTGLKANGVSKSRASVINYLNRLVDLGLIGYESRTGKGGYHRIYRVIMTRSQFEGKIIDMFLAALQTAFPNNSFLREAFKLE